MKKLIILGNGTDWCEKALSGFDKYDNVYIYRQKLPISGEFLNKVARIHFSTTINRYIKLPFKSIWYNKIEKLIDLKKLSKEELCILVYDRNKLGAEESFIKYIKRKYPNVKLAYIFTNIVKHTAATESDYIDKLNDWYDAVFAFDPEDALKYGFSYSPLIYDADLFYSKGKTESASNLVFYVGQAKDRLDGLLGVYRRMKELNIDSDFHITNVEAGQQEFVDAIVYNQFMTYEDCVRHIQKATCLVDIIQGDSTGLTIKNCEAICYNKKLITTNRHIKEYPFYDPRYIRVIEKPEDIDLAFFNNNIDVEYSKEGAAYFSADIFWDKLWGELD